MTQHGREAGWAWAHAQLPTRDVPTHAHPWLRYWVILDINTGRMILV